MAPNLLSGSSLYSESENTGEPVQIISKPGQDHYAPVKSKSPAASPKSGPQPYRWQLVWRNILIFIYLHVAAFYGIYYIFAAAQWKTILWTYLFAVCAGVGITAGAHRLWAHRAYKAKLPLRIILAAFQTMALQNDLIEWVRDHRVHHKFTDSDADPHNASRGFFFSHMGWLLVRKHRDVTTKGKTVDLSDMEADPVCRVQRKFYLILTPIMAFVFPTWVPWYFWGEDFFISWYVAGMFRYVISLHGTWLVNSAAHIWGTKPYDKTINPTENTAVAIIAFGEGWHNYHHVFPWDYKAAELGNYRTNISTAFIDLMAKIGWAYDLKSVSAEMVRKRTKRTGDGSNAPDYQVKQHGHEHQDCIWGWGDRDMKEDDKEMVQISHHHDKAE